MVGVDDHGGVGQFFFSIEFQHMLQVVVMVIGNVAPGPVHVAAQDRVGVGVAAGPYFPSPVQAGVTALGGDDRVHHHGEIAAGGVLHAHWDAHAAGGQPVLLVFYGARADGYIG